jgi:hypothetical protein
MESDNCGAHLGYRNAALFLTLRNYFGLRGVPGGAKGIRTSDLRGTGTRALTPAPLPGPHTAEGAPLDPA